MKNEAPALKMLEKKKTMSRYGIGFLLVLSISIIILFAYMLDNSNAALYYQALLYLTGILSIPIILLMLLLYPHAKEPLIFNEQTINEMNQTLFKNCLCYGNGFLLYKKFKISKINCSHINSIRFYEKKAGVHTIYYLIFCLPQKEISFSFSSNTFIFDDLNRLKKLIQTIQYNHPHIIVTQLSSSRRNS